MKCSKFSSKELSISVQVTPQSPYKFLLNKSAKKIKNTIFAAMRLRSLAMLLSILIVCQIGAAWTIFSTAIWLHKQSKQTRINDAAKWEYFRLSPADFAAFLVEDDEIVIENTLYDIVSFNESDGIVEIYVVADAKENKMKRTLRGLQNDSAGWSEFAEMAQEFSTTPYHTERTLEVLATQLNYNLVHFSFYDEVLCAGMNRKPEQPPCL